MRPPRYWGMHVAGPPPIPTPRNWRPQPVLAAATTALAVEIIGLAIASGVPVNDEQRLHMVGVIGAAGTLIGLLLAWRASRKVTPLESPRDDDGVRLVPVDQVEQRDS